MAKIVWQITVLLFVTFTTCSNPTLARTPILPALSQVHVVTLSQFLGTSSNRQLSELPEFGGIALTDEQKHLNEEFIQAIKLSGISPNFAAEVAIKKGWQYLALGDPLTAMRRFNQSWLLKPNKPDSYWGFGVASAELGDFSSAQHYLHQAENMMPANVQVLADFGKVLLMEAENKITTSEKQDLLNKAVAKYKRAVDIDPLCAEAYLGWAWALHMQGQNKEALEKLLIAEQLDTSMMNQQTKQEVQKAYSNLVSGNK